MKINTKQKYLLLFCMSVILLLSVSFAFFFVGKAFLKSNFVSKPLSNEKQNYTVVIDAGHGGFDGGASVGEVIEKDLTLSIATSLSDFLRLYDIDVVMTRTGDYSLASQNTNHKKREDLLNRLKLTNNYDNPIFVSVHVNKFPESKYKGLQVFHSKNNPLSEAVALIIQSNTKKNLQPTNNRNIKKANSAIYLLDRLQCPSVLVECGFISNPEEAQLLTDEAYQKKLTFVIASSIIEFINL